MFLRIRPALFAELEQFLPFTRDAFVFDDVQMAQLLEMWRALHRDRSGSFLVFEDREAPPGANIVYFCLIVFAAPGFAAEMKTTLPPFIGLQVLKRRQAGASPLLSLPEIRQANAQGDLSMVCLQSGIAPQFISGPEGREVRDKVVEWMWYACDGYGLKECFIEAYSAFSHDWQRAAGFQVCREYDPRCAELTALPPGQRACLMHGDRWDDHEGTFLMRLFTRRPPRFGFSLVEQEQLLWAALGLTDAELSQALSVVEVTVRKRWERIYQRIAEAAPAFFGCEREMDGKRGMERKRRVVDYLRTHMEELRPYV